MWTTRCSVQREHRSSLNRVPFSVVFVVAAVLFFAAVPSAKATSYSVEITGGTGGGCASGSFGTLTISGSTLEFTSSSGCYFGTVGYDSGASTCNGTHCSPDTNLDNMVADTEYVFMNTSSLTTNVGACSASGTCTTANTSLSMDVYFDDSGACGGASNDCISVGSNNNLTGCGKTV